MGFITFFFLLCLFCVLTCKVAYLCCTYHLLVTAELLLLYFCYCCCCSYYYHYMLVLIVTHSFTPSMCSSYLSGCHTALHNILIKHVILRLKMNWELELKLEEACQRYGTSEHVCLCRSSLRHLMAAVCFLKLVQQFCHTLHFGCMFILYCVCVCVCRFL